MADVIAKLQVDSSQYDQKIKTAIDQMTKMEQEVRRTGATFAYADKAELEFVRSLGQLETSASSARQKMMEYTNAITSLTATYRAMTAEEKQSDFGKGLAASIDELKAKAATLKDIMSDTQREITNLASDTSFTDGLGLMTRTVGSCAAAITAWSGKGKEMDEVVKELAKIGATVAAVDSLTKALQKQNLVLLKNPYVAAAAAVVALGVAIGKVIQKSQELSAVEKALQDVQTKGRENSAKEVARIETLNNILHDNTRSLEERRSALAQIQSLVPDYHGALTAEGTLINDNTDAMDGYIDSLQRAATAQAAFDKMVELQKTKMEKQVELQKAQKELAAAQSMQSAGVPNGAAAFGGNGGMSINTAVAGTNNMAVKTAESAVNSIQKVIDEQDAQINALRELVSANDIGITGDKSSKPVGTVKVAAEIELPEGSAAKLKQKIAELQKQWDYATSDEDRSGIQKQIDAAQEALDAMSGKAQPIEVPITFTEQGISNLGSQIRDRMSKLKIGSGGYLIAARNMLDFTTFENLLKVATERGVQIDPEWMSSLFEDIKVGAEVDADSWQALVDDINKKLAELDLPPIKLDVKTGAVSKTGQEVGSLTDNVNGAISAFGQLGGAIQQIDDPSAKVAGIVMGAVAEVAGTFAASLKGTFTPWDWIAAALSGTATMISTITAIKSATSGNYASGGKIPGNSFSGDNMRGILPNGDLIGLDAGEVILNRAQQSNIAGQLENNNPLGNLQLTSKVRGSDLLIVLDNTNSSRGGQRGMYVNVK